MKRSCSFNMIPATEDSMMSAPRFGVGIDLISITRIEEMVTRWGKRFLDRVFTSGEITYCEAKHRPAVSLAARFAAKEAFFKAVSPWNTRSIAYKNIEVVIGENGIPLLRTQGAAREALGNLTAALSLSHDSEYAVAVVVTSPEVKD